MTQKQRRGFAAMDEARRREIAQAGGRAAHQSGNAHQFTRQEAQAAGRKGGVTVSRNRHHMAEIGRKGGQEAQRRGTAHQWSPEEARAAGRQGGRFARSQQEPNPEAPNAEEGD